MSSPHDNTLSVSLCSRITQDMNLKPQFCKTSCCMPSTVVATSQLFCQSSVFLRPRFHLTQEVINVPLRSATTLCLDRVLECRPVLSETEQTVPLRITLVLLHLRAVTLFHAYDKSIVCFLAHTVTRLLHWISQNRLNRFVAFASLPVEAVLSLPTQLVVAMVNLSFVSVTTWKY